MGGGGEVCGGVVNGGRKNIECGNCVQDVDPELTGVNYLRFTEGDYREERKWV